MTGFLACAAPAWALDCPPPQIPKEPVKVNFTTQTAPVDTHNTLSRRQISAVARQEGVGGGQEAGLTRVESRLTLKPHMLLADMGNNRFCVVVREIEAVWSLPTIRVDIAEEYRPGSCTHAAVKDHENQHVENNLKAFRDHRERMRQRLELVAQSAQPRIVIGDRQSVGQKVVNDLMAGMRPALEAFEAQRRAADAAIDTPESYRQVQSLCRNW